MMKLLTLVGARPQFIKAAAISRAIRNHFANEMHEVIVHSGQHYDANMSKVFFDELNIPREDYNLGAGSGTHAQQTAAIMTGCEEILLKEKPDALLLYGDTNSTVAASLAASKIHVPIIHVEGGVRSYNKSYPEEVNRLVCDHLSTLIFVPTRAGMQALAKEGFDADARPQFTADNPKVYHCGDIMYDNSMHFAEVAKSNSGIIKQTGVEGKRFFLVTIHRPNNVDDAESLNTLFSTFDEISKSTNTTMVIPLHPRTKNAMKENLASDLQQRLEKNPLMKIIPSVSFLDMIALETLCDMVMTDSGGVQKEAYYFRKPCVNLLNDTPWIELVESGSAILAGNDSEKIKDAVNYFELHKAQLKFPEIFGDGHASEFICRKILDWHTQQ